MDDTFRDQADGHHTASSDVADRPLPASDRLPVVRSCCWCKEILIRPGSVRAEDALIVFVYGNERKVIWNGHELIIQDGICERCRETKFPETTQPRAQTGAQTPNTKEEKQP